MAEKVKRTKTKYANIYFNESTEKYDVKYNYKVYNPTEQKNDYKQKWIYNIGTLAEAKKQLAVLQSEGTKAEDKDITLEGIFALWNRQAKATSKSEVTIRNTEQQFNMLVQFIPKETKLKNITDDVYYDTFVKIKEKGYAEETIHSLNACFRKLINLAYKKKLITENPLHTSENVKTKKKNSDDYRILTHEEYTKIDNYLHNTKFIRLGVDRYVEFRFFFNLLYYTGMRVGEALALTYNDFVEFSYYKNKEEEENAPLRLVPRDTTNEEHVRGMQIRVNKSYVSEMKLTKDPKNKKNRQIPIPPCTEYLFEKYKAKHLARGGKLTDRVFTCDYGTYLDIITKACKKIGIDHISPHGFRHTYISNLISKGVPLPVIEKVSGDTQETIIKTYSHLFEQDILQVLVVMQNL